MNICRFWRVIGAPAIGRCRCWCRTSNSIYSFCFSQDAATEDETEEFCGECWVVGFYLLWVVWRGFISERYCVGRGERGGGKKRTAWWMSAIVAVWEKVKGRSSKPVAKRMCKVIGEVGCWVLL